MRHDPNGRRGPAQLAFAGALLALAAWAPPAAAEKPAQADVVEVKLREGRPGSFRFGVTVRSPDRDCDLYAAWWEVVRANGTLVYRRVLKHSHPDEQPFMRPGGPVRVDPDETLVVRAYMHPTGYGGVAFRGTAAGGFEPWKDADPDFARELAEAPPQPTECWH